MPRGFGPASRRASVWSAAACALLAVLASCAGPGGRESAYYGSPHHHYAPPGPPGDPWGPYIREAALRFGIPETWVRAVMRQESGGREDAVSSAGAMGLMQIMPDTYALLRARYGLGGDPYEPHDNIMAGAGYIRELYDRYGAPGFLAAYNAGPRRLEAYLGSGTPLPDETVGYLSSVAPKLGAGTPMTGPLAVFAGPATQYAAAAPLPPVASSTLEVAGAQSASCDRDAAYDPDRPCTPSQYAPAPPEPAMSSPAPIQMAALPSPVPYQPPAAAYTPAYHAPLQATYSPSPRSVLPPLVYGTPHEAAAEAHVQLASLSAAPRGSWAIQVGAFASPGTARAAAAGAQRSLPDLLSAGDARATATTPFGGTVLYRARVVALTESSAAAACARLSERGAACIAVPPGR